MFIGAATGDSTVFAANEGPATELTTVMLPMPGNPRWALFTPPGGGVAILDTQSKASLWLSY